MAFNRRLKDILRQRPRLSPENREQGAESGIALFIVISAMTVLSLLVTDFVYIAKVGQRMAYDGLDQLKAHYLAKSGLKISLLRLKAYQQVKALTGGNKSDGSGGANPAAGAIPGVPKGLIEKIWSFPFFYPLPKIPGMTEADKERIDKFQSASRLEGKFSAVIESESSRYNLNMILAPYVPAPNASPSPTPSGGGTNTGSTSPNPNPSPTPFDPEVARKSLADYLGALLQQKFEADPDFQNEYRDFRLDDFMDALVAWADRTYERRNAGTRSLIPSKRAPFYSVNELHMIEGMDDRLFELFAPALTVSTTPGLNINTMGDATLKALVPQMIEDERKAFFEFRDSTEQDNLFKDGNDFLKYLQSNVQAFNNDPQEIKRFQDSLTQRNIRLVTDETSFKITVQAEMNQATRLLEAWVTLLPASKTKPSGPGTNANNTAAQPTPDPGATPTDGSAKSAQSNPTGLKITFMKML